MHYVNTNQKKAEVALLISDRVDFRVTNTIRNTNNIYTDKGNNSLRKCNHPIWDCVHLITEP